MKVNNCNLYLIETKNYLSLDWHNKIIQVNDHTVPAIPIIRQPHVSFNIIYNLLMSLYSQPLGQLPLSRDPLLFDLVVPWEAGI